MKNLKKLLAVIVAVCVLATMAIPAFAAETTPTDAEICEQLGVLKGDGAGVTDAYLAKGTERYQAAILYLRLLGLEAEAAAFDGEENFDDADLIYAGGQKILAYLKANPDLGWVGVGGNKFDPKGAASAQMIYKVLLEALGYEYGTDFTWADTIDFAATVGLSKIADVTELTNADLATALVEALKADVKGGEQTLAEKLIEDGIIDEEDAIEVGLIEEEVEPAELLATGASADNLKEIILTFNKAVNGDTVKTDNIKLKKDGITVSSYTVSLKDDKQTVVIKAAAGANFANQEDYKIEIKDVKDADGNAIKAVTLDVKPFDATLPEVRGIKVTGPKSLEIQFSEPIKDGGTRSVSVKSGTTTIGVNSTFTGYDTDTINVSLYTNLTDGKTYTIAIKGFEDFAGYKMINYSSDIAYAADKTEITATVEKAEQTYVVIKFNKPVKIDGTAVDFFYHTFSAWKPMGVYTNAEMTTPVSSSTAVDKIYLKFAEGTTGYPLREGTTNLVIRDTANDKKIKDNWDNAFLGATLTVEVTADKTPPTVTDLTVESESSLKVKFDENVTFKDSNVEVLNGDGSKNNDIKITVTGSGKEYIINLGTSLAGKTIIVTIKNVEDTALTPNKLVSYTVTIDVTDKTAPQVSKVTKKIVVGGEQALYVFFNEAMGDSALSKDNYFFKSSDTWKKISNTPAFYDGNKVVRIELTDDEKGYVSGSYDLVIMGVKDTAGNTLIAKTVSNGDIKAFDDATNAPKIEKVQATSTTTVDVTFDQFLTDVDATAFTVNTKAVSGMALSTNDKGNTVVTLTTADDGKFNYDISGAVVAMTPSGTAKVANIFGVNAASATKTPGAADDAIKDKIAPAVKENGITTLDIDGDFKIDHIKIEFEEAMKFNYVSPANFEVADYTVQDAYAATVAPTSATDRTGATVDDSAVIYVRVTEKDDPDTGVKPNVKIKGTLKDAAGNDYKVSDDAIASVDKVAPKVTATATSAEKKVTFVFSEAVYTNSSGTLTDVVITDFTINDTGAGTIGTATISVSSDKKTVTITFDGTVEAGDNVVLKASEIYDAAGNAVGTVTATF
jgi:hypothetical protein